MEFVEHSFESLHADSRRLSCLIERDGFIPDAVAYLARGGWLIGKAVSDYFDVPLIELSAHRSGEKVKNDFSGLLRMMPRGMRYRLRKWEIAQRLSKDSGQVQQKTMVVTNRYEFPSHSNRILLVDDSMDTGASIRAAVRCIESMCPKSEIRTAVLNSWIDDNLSCDADWTLYRNVLLCLPSSKDSKLYRKFCEKYETEETL